MRHAVIPRGGGVGGVEEGVDVRGEGGVADARLAEGGGLGVPPAGEEVEGGEGGDGAAEGVADEDEGVVGVLG